jgi:hypothetical protein
LPKIKEDEWSHQVFLKPLIIYSLDYFITNDNH